MQLLIISFTLFISMFSLARAAESITSSTIPEVEHDRRMLELDKFNDMGASRDMCGDLESPFRDNLHFFCRGTLQPDASFCMLIEGNEPMKQACYDDIAIRMQMNERRK